MDRLVQDLRIALRRLRGSPTFTATAVLILGLGIGMAVAMSTVFDAVLVRSLPVHDQDRIVLPRTIDAGGVDVGVTQPELAEWLRRSRTIRDAAGVFHPGATSEAFMDGDRPIVLNLASVTHNFFDVLGARPALGRFLRPDDEGAGAGWGGAVVISYDTWQRRFGGDSGVLGHQFVEPLAQSRFTIVGVAPAGLDYPLGVECWRSVPTAWLALQDWDAVARLLPTASPTTARSEFLLIMQQIDRQRSYRQTDPGSRLVTGATIQTFTQAVIGGVRPALRVLTGAVALLLLIACVNVGTLLVLRATARGREIAIRRSLGANSADIARALLVESASLGLAGGGARARVRSGVPPRPSPAFAPWVSARRRYSACRRTRRDRFRRDPGFGGGCWRTLRWLQEPAVPSSRPSGITRAPGVALSRGAVYDSGS